MKAKTHIAGAVCVGAGACVLLQTPLWQSAGILLASGVGSLLPDIDCATSKIGRKTAPISWIITLVFGHRQMFHSLTLWLAITIPLIILAPVSRTILLSGQLGILSHLFLDALNPSGIPPFWPIRYRFRIASISCGGITDFALFLVFGLTSIYLLSTHLANLL